MISGIANFKDDFGAVGGWRMAADSSMSQFSNLLNSPSAKWTAADIGSILLVNGAGVGGSTLVTTIAAGTVTNPDGTYFQVRLATANQTITNFANNRINWGPQDDTPAVVAAMTHVAATGDELFVPPGVYAIQGINATRLTSFSMRGVGGVNNQASGSQGSTFIPICDGAVLLDLSGTMEPILEKFQLGHEWQAAVGRNAMFAANLSDGTPSGDWAFRKITVAGYWDHGSLYTYGANTATLENCSFTNNRPGSIAVILTQDNPYGLGSPHQSIATGFQGCGDFHFRDGGAACAEGISNVPSVYLRGTGSLTFENFKLVGSQTTGTGVVQCVQVNGTNPSMALHTCNFYNDGTPTAPYYNIFTETPGMVVGVQYDPFTGWTNQGGSGRATAAGGNGSVSWALG